MTLKTLYISFHNKTVLTQIREFIIGISLLGPNFNLVTQKHNLYQVKKFPHPLSEQ